MGYLNNWFWKLMLLTWRPYLFGAKEMNRSYIANW